MPIFNVQTDAPYKDAGNVRRTNYGGWVTNSAEAQRIKTEIEQDTQGMGYVITTNNVGNFAPADGILRVMQSWDEWPSDPGFKRFFFEGVFETDAERDAAAGSIPAGRTREDSNFAILQDGEWDSV
jgi:hypothetical protein